MTTNCGPTHGFRRARRYRLRCSACHRERRAWMQDSKLHSWPWCLRSLATRLRQSEGLGERPHHVERLCLESLSLCACDAAAMKVLDGSHTPIAMRVDGTLATVRRGSCRWRAAKELFAITLRDKSLPAELRRPSIRYKSNLNIIEYH